MAQQRLRNYNHNIVVQHNKKKTMDSDNSIAKSPQRYNIILKRNKNCNGLGKWQGKDSATTIIQLLPRCPTYYRAMDACEL